MRLSWQACVPLSRAVAMVTPRMSVIIRWRAQRCSDKGYDSATQMAVLSGDASPRTTAGKCSETAGWEHEVRGGDGRYRGENRASPVNEALSVKALGKSTVRPLQVCEVRTCNYA